MTTSTANQTGVEQSIPAYIRQRELMTLLPFSRSTLWRKVKNGTFVRPVQLSSRIIAWNRTQVLAWLEAKGGEQ